MHFFPSCLILSQTFPRFISPPQSQEEYPSHTSPSSSAWCQHIWPCPSGHPSKTLDDQHWFLEFTGFHHCIVWVGEGLEPIEKIGILSSSIKYSDTSCIMSSVVLFPITPNTPYPAMTLALLFISYMASAFFQHQPFHVNLDAHRHDLHPHAHVLEGRSLRMDDLPLETDLLYEYKPWLGSFTMFSSTSLTNSLSIIARRAGFINIFQWVLMFLTLCSHIISDRFFLLTSFPSIAWWAHSKSNQLLKTFVQFTVTL